MECRSCGSWTLTLPATGPRGFPRIEREVANDGALGRRAAHVGDQDAVLAVLPEVRGALPGIRLLAETVVRRPVITSPYRSGITGKVYEPGDEQGPHRDSNPLTALLVLQGPAPVFADPASGWMPPGDCGGLLFVFQGRRLWHHVPPNGGRKAVIVFNLYHPEDTWRPPDQDVRIYGG